MEPDTGEESCAVRKKQHKTRPSTSLDSLGNDLAHGCDSLVDLKPIHSRDIASVEIPPGKIVNKITDSTDADLIECRPPLFADTLEIADRRGKIIYSFLIH